MQVDQILDPLLSIEALCYGALRTITLSDKLESGISDITTESVIHFCGSEIQTIPSPKLEASVANVIQRIRNLENLSTETIRKYFCYILESLIQGKLLTPRDHLLLTSAVSNGLLKLLDDNGNGSKAKEEMKETSLEVKELQRKLENSAITLEETRAEMKTEVEKLTNELNEAKEKILSFESELSTQNQLATETSQKLETQISQLTQLTEELESERKSTSDLTQKLRECEEQIRVNKDLESSAQGQQEMVQRLQTELQQIQEATTEKSECIQNLQNDLALKQTEIVSKENEISELKASYEKERDQNISFAAEVAELKSQVELRSILESSSAEQQEAIERLQSELQRLKAQVAEKSDWVSSAEMSGLLAEKDSLLEEKIVEIAKLKESLSHNESTEIRSLQGHISELESLLSQNTTEHQVLIQNLQNDFASKESEISELKASYEKERDQNISLVEELKSQVELRSILESSSAEQQERLQSLQQELRETQQDLSIVQNELTETQQELSSKFDWISPQDLSKQKEVWENLKFVELTELQKRIDNRETQFEELQSENSSLHEELDRLVIEEEKTKEILKQKVDEMTRLYEQCVVDKDLLQQEVRQVHQDSFDFKNKITSLQKQIDDQEKTWISPENAQQIADGYEGTINSLKSQLLEQLKIIETLQLKITAQEELIATSTAAMAATAAGAFMTESNESSERDEKLDLSLIQLEKFQEIIRDLKTKNAEMEDRNETNEKLIAEKIQLIRKLEQEKHLLSSLPQPKAESSGVNGSKTYFHHTLTTAAPILFFEIGSFVTRIGIWRESHFVQWSFSPHLPSSHPYVVSPVRQLLRGQRIKILAPTI